MWTWGDNLHGQLGNGVNTGVGSTIPVPVTGNLTSVVAIAGGHYHNLAVKSGGTVWAWGYNQYGQLGNGISGPNINSSIPVPVSGNLSGVVAVAAGSDHSLALKSDGTVWAWGRNFYGQLGTGTNTNSSIPVQVSGNFTGVVAIAAGADNSLAVKSDGTAWAWGRNHFGQLGIGNYTNTPFPIQVSNLTGVVTIAGGVYHSLAVNANGTAWAWGYNNSGQLGNGGNANSPFPLPVSGNFSGVVAVAGGYLHSLALRSDGSEWAWGSSGSGQLGNGTNTNSPIPVQVKNPSGTGYLAGVMAIAAGYRHSLALVDPNVIPPPPSLTVISPDGGETWAFGSTHGINWSSANLGGNAGIDISFNSGSTWYNIISSVPVSAGTASWLASVPATTTHTRIRVMSLSNFVTDMSNADFIITGPPPPTLTVTSPDGGESWAVGSTQNITWTAPGLAGHVNIEFSFDGGIQWDTIDGNALNSGSYPWTVLSQVTNHARVRVSAVSDPTVYDMSNADFRITGPTAFSARVQPLREGTRILVVRKKDGAIAGRANLDEKGTFRIALNNPGQPCGQRWFDFWIISNGNRPPSETSVVSLEINVCNDLSVHEFSAWQMNTGPGAKVIVDRHSGRMALQNDVPGRYDYGITEEGIR